MKRLCRLDELANRTPLLIHIGRKGFLVYRNEQEVHVLGHECTHHGGALVDGIVTDGEIVCPLHHARFSVESGDAMAAPAFDGLSRFPTEIIDGEVYIDRPADRAFAERPKSPRETTVIVGGGAAGLACAERLRKRAYEGEIVIIEAGAEAPYDRTLLSKRMLLSPETAPRLGIRDPEYFDAIGIDLRTSTRVDEIDREARRVICADGTAIAYDSLVVATGCAARSLALPGASSLPGHTIRNVSDLKRLQTALEGRHLVTIVGAGFLALEVAAALRTRGFSVTVVAPEMHPLEPVFGIEIATAIEELHRTHGVEFRLGHRPVRWDSTRSRIEIETTAPGGEAPCIKTEVLIEAVGAQPRTTLLSKAGLCAEGEPVTVDADNRTSDPAIYAAGDIAAAVRLPGGVSKVCEHWVSAMRQGETVADAIAGAPPSPPDVPFFWTEQYDTTLGCVGIPGAKSTRKVFSDQRSMLVTYRDDHGLLAAAGFGCESALMQIEASFRRGDPIGDEEIVRHLE